MKITIAHLYPDLLNLYGDNGNITALTYRLRKRGIEAKVIEYGIDDEIDFDSSDIIFIGGGSDRELKVVCRRMYEYKERLREYAEKGGCILAVCGGFQILGNYYMLGSEKIEATGVLDIHADHNPERLIGDVIIESELIGSTIVGFENHAGRMHIGRHTPLGRVLAGNGNNSEDKTEGVVYKNVVASYMHGPLLPKNPLLTDHIISKAMENRYGSAKLSPLDDTLENQAHKYIADRLLNKKKLHESSF